MHANGKENAMAWYNHTFIKGIIMKDNSVCLLIQLRPWMCREKTGKYFIQITGTLPCVPPPTGHPNSVAVYFRHFVEGQGEPMQRLRRASLRLDVLKDAPNLFRGQSRRFSHFLGGFPVV